MTNSLESEAEEDEKKDWNIPLQPPTNQIWGFLIALSEKKGVEVWKAIMFLMLGFYTEHRKKVFTPFFLPSKLNKQTLGLICLNLHFEIA